MLSVIFVLFFCFFAEIMGMPFYFTKPFTLIMSNYPESLKEPGNLVSQQVKSSHGRLLYYHKSLSKDPLTLIVWIANVTDKPILFQWMGLKTGPHKDGVHVGHMLTKQWLAQKENPHLNQCILEPLKPKKMMVHTFAYDQVVAGLCQWEAPSGSVYVLMAAKDSTPEHIASILPQAQYTAGTFTLTDALSSIDLDPKSVAQEIPVGDKPYAQDPRTGIVLKGNYGQLLRLTLNLNNTELTPLPVHCLISPVAGIGRAQFLIQDAWMQTGFFEKKTGFEPQLVAKWMVDPISSKQVVMWTTPQVGSFYPMNIVLQTKKRKIKNDN
jgi:hypothetical protein